MPPPAAANLAATASAAAAHVRWKLCSGDYLLAATATGESATRSAAQPGHVYRTSPTSRCAFMAAAAAPTATGAAMWPKRPAQPYAGTCGGKSYKPGTPYPRKGSYATACTSSPGPSAPVQPATDTSRCRHARRAEAHSTATAQCSHLAGTWLCLSAAAAAPWPSTSIRQCL